MARIARKRTVSSIELGKGERNVKKIADRKTEGKRGTHFIFHHALNAGI